MRRPEEPSSAPAATPPPKKSAANTVIVSDEGSISDSSIAADSPLAEFDPFSHLPANVRELLEARLKRKEVPGGEVLIEQDAPADSLMVLQSGTALVTRNDDVGGDRYLGRVEAGGVLGEMALLTDQPRQATVLAESDCVLLVLSAADFNALANEHPEIAIVLTRFLANRIGSPEGDVLCGQEFSGYRIVDRLGRGGMSVVYRAVHVADGEVVAAKMMSHRLAYEDAALKQFAREAEVIATFDHPRVTRLIGQFEAFRTFFSVVPFCDGITLADFLDERGPLPESITRKLVGQIVEGLDYAHRQGVVHRDIKPANVMLERDGTIKLLDFGLAQPVDDPEFDGLIVGTPRYMAPEQLKGELVTPAADYFSLGCLCCELLTGEPLLEEMGVLRLLRKHKKWPVTKWVPDNISTEFRDLLRCWMCKQPADREFDIKQITLWAESLTDDERQSWFQSEHKP